MALPNKTFWCNYNARNYNSTTLTLPKENGQLFDNDLVFPSAVTYNHNHITIRGDKRVHFTFNSTSENIFNRTSSTANITIIAKLSPTNSTWFFANRDGNAASQVGYLVALGRNYRFEFVNYSYTASTSPMIFTWRCGNGDMQYIAHSDNVVGTPYQSTNWARGEMKNIYFFGSNISSESWAGDFYWLYMSPETLTDAEIQQVIDYNENIQQPVIPVNKYKLYTSNIQKTYNGSTKINKMYVGNDLVYRALPTTTPAPSCGSGIPSDEVWYKASQVTYPYRPYYYNNSWFSCNIDGTGSNNYIISNTYDSTDGWYKIKWSCDFVKSCGSGWYTKSGITEVIYPDCFQGEDAENWNQCTGITKITYGNSVTYLDQGACPPNVTDIYMYTTTPPDMNPSQDQRGDYFRLHNRNIPLTLHLPYGSDWSGVTLPSEVTVVYDLCV